MNNDRLTIKEFENYHSQFSSGRDIRCIIANDQNGNDLINKWISVKEKLPEIEKKNVLLWFSDSKCTFVGYIENGIFEVSFCDWYTKYHEVTFWCPLPESPKETKRHE